MSSRGKKVGVSKKKTITKKRKEKDPDAPKRPKTAYIFYSSEERSKVKEENPTMGFGDITKQLSAKWKEMSEEEKDPYVKMAQKDKERYEKEMSKYKESAGASSKKATKKKKKQSSEDEEDDDDDDEDSD